MGASLSASERLLQQEFDEWARTGECEDMEQRHLDIVTKTIRFMDLGVGDRVLDLGCGSGWVTRLIGRLIVDPIVPSLVVGLDISAEMVRIAREESADYPNVRFFEGAARSLPFENRSFDKVISVESFYYYPDQGAVLSELHRVLRPAGRLFILFGLYQENPFSLQWIPHLKVPVQVRTIDEYVRLLVQHGFIDVKSRQIRDETPTPDDYQPVFFRSLADMREFKKIGSLLLTAGIVGA